MIWITNIFLARFDVISLIYIVFKNTFIILKYTLQIKLTSIIIKTTSIILRYASHINHKSIHKSVTKSITKSCSGLLIQIVRSNNWTIPDNPSKTSDRPIKIVGLNDLDRPD